MRYLIPALCLTLTVMVAGSAWAAEGDADGQTDRRAEMRKKILEEFDADGDGELNEDERAKAREEMRGRRGDRATGGRQRPEAGERRGRPGGPDRQGPGRQGPGRQGPGRQGPGRQGGGQGGQPDPGKVFDQFDANGDGQLSREEFMKLHESRPRRGPEGQAGPPRREGQRGEGRRGEGERGEARRPRFERNQPLQNPGDRPGPPRDGQRRRLRDEDTSQRGPRAGARGGDRARGAEGIRPPRPEEVFDRFDKNDDDQLSREEFMAMAEQMRQMRDARGGQRGERGARPGRGQRQGPSRGEGPAKRKRPSRPEMDDATGVETSANDDNSV